MTPVTGVDREIDNMLVTPVTDVDREYDNIIVTPVTGVDRKCDNNLVTSSLSYYIWLYVIIVMRLHKLSISLCGKNI